MFYTKINISNSDHKLNYDAPMLSVGSCFSENIGLKLQNAYFDIDINPFGVLFNPISIRQSISDLLENKHFTASDLMQTGSLWGSFGHSTLFSDVDAAVCLAKINERAAAAAKKLTEAKTLIITFGTAWVYRHIATDKVVANCHKVDAKEFIRFRLAASEIAEQYIILINQLKAVNPALQIIFTVSPVRHIKDGATENNISKGILLQAIQAITKLTPNTHYFPAYELMVDELRDYRYYANDMLHPSETAINYIFDRFCEAFFSSQTMMAYKEICQYNSTKSHRPLHPESSEYNLFIQNLELKKCSLIDKYSFLKSYI